MSDQQQVWALKALAQSQDWHGNGMTSAQMSRNCPHGPIPRPAIWTSMIMSPLEARGYVKRIDAVYPICWSITYAGRKALEASHD